MKRIFSLIAVIIVAVVLTSDIGLVIKYDQNPDAYSLLKDISFVHYFIFVTNGIQFALAKLLFSALLFVLWAWRAIYPAKVYLLAYITYLYSFTWILIGALVLTGIVGVLQYSAGLPLNLCDFTLLFISAPLGLIALVAIGLPLILLGLPRLHNRSIVRTNAKQAAAR